MCFSRRSKHLYSVTNQLFKCGSVKSEQTFRLWTNSSQVSFANFLHVALLFIQHTMPSTLRPFIKTTSKTIKQTLWGESVDISNSQGRQKQNRSHACRETNIKLQFRHSQNDKLQVNGSVVSTLFANVPFYFSVWMLNRLSLKQW